MSGGRSLDGVHRVLLAAASLVGEHGRQCTWTSAAVVCGLSTWGSGLWSMDLSSCGVWAQYLGLPGMDFSSCGAQA